MKRILLPVLCLLFLQEVSAQVNQSKKIQFRPQDMIFIHNAPVFKLPATGIVNNKKTTGINLASMDRILSLPVTYIFTGNGNWDDPNNWFNNVIPPSTLPGGSEIDISPTPGGECVLNVTQTIAPGGIFMITTNASFRILTDLTLL